MYGRLALHAESVTLPLLAPDAPVVAWWYSETPEVIAYDPLGVFADRRITNVIRDRRPVGLAASSGPIDYAPGDTDLTWTVITPWRAALASAFDTVHGTPASVGGGARQPGRPVRAAAGRLAVVPAGPRRAGREGRGQVHHRGRSSFDDGHEVEMTNEGYKLVMRRPGQMDTIPPFPPRTTGDLLAEELRRLDADEPYAEALGAVTGETGLNERPAVRTHIWHDPALAQGGLTR